MWYEIAIISAVFAIGNILFGHFEEMTPKWRRIFGGEGMGPLEEMAVAIDKARLPVGLAIVTGRNKTLREHLEARKWHLPVYIYGFVRAMPQFMNAADILVTKAGPGTISEAFIAGLPMVLYSRLPGQEDGNVTFVAQTGTGSGAPELEMVVGTLRKWLRDPAQREKAAQMSRSLAARQAAREIARILAEYAEKGSSLDFCFII